MKRTIILLACTASLAFSAFAQHELIDHEVSRLLSCGCGCFDYKTGGNMDILTLDLPYSVQKLHKHVNDTTPCAKLRIYELTRKMLRYADSSSRDAVLRYAVLYASDTTTQRVTIDQEVNRLLGCGCRCSGYEENEAVLKQDLAYTVERLHYYLLNDTTPCVKARIHYLTAVMLNYVDSSSYDIVFHYNMLYARDTANKRNYYNSIVDIIRATVLDDIKRPLSVTQFIGSPEFYKATTWQLPLLISYLDMFGEIENLKKWGHTYSLDELQKEILSVSLLRLGDSAATQEYMATTPTNSDDWDLYITGLNYARTKPATERLISLLNNTEKVYYERFSYSDDPQTYYTTVRTLALETLAFIIEDFPLGRLNVPYEDDHFSEVSEQDIKKAKRWLKKNPNYKIIRQSNYNY